MTSLISTRRGRAFLAACSGLALLAALDRPASAQTVLSVTDATSLNNAIATIDGGAAGQTFTVNIQNNITLTAATTLNAINTANTVVINGGNTTLDGGEVQRGFFVFAGTVSINNLTIQNTLARGGEQRWRRRRRGGLGWRFVRGERRACHGEQCGADRRHRHRRHRRR